jgi:cyclopropane fatty-acyl-phospholipid synthase-like methyltransferase
MPSSPLQIRQSRRYSAAGRGTIGVLLKHSLYPLTYLKRVLPTRGTVLDLGCGDGMLTNLLAASLPGTSFVGLDRDPHRIRTANQVASPNASFHLGDIIDCRIRGAAAVILNDVLHHHPLDRQVDLLAAASENLDDDGVMILKEVDQRDAPDVFWTRFWDGRLYPGDTLHFRSAGDWHDVLHRCGLRLLDTHRSRHPWPASRTLFVAAHRLHPARNQWPVG